MRSITEPQKRALLHLQRRKSYEHWMPYQGIKINPVVLRKLEEKGMVESWYRGPRIIWLLTSAGDNIACELSYAENVVNFDVTKNA